MTEHTPEPAEGERRQANDRSKRRQALDRMVEIAEESGMYDLTATPKRTR